MIKRARDCPSTNFNLLDRDISENIWLWRHRQRSGSSIARGRRADSLSQPEAAKLIGLTATQYIKLENGDSTLVTAADLANLINWDGWGELEDDPSLAELCFLARRRSGLAINDISAKLDISRTTFAKMEAEGDERIRDFWIGRGYTFTESATSRSRRELERMMRGFHRIRRAERKEMAMQG